MHIPSKHLFRTFSAVISVVILTNTAIPAIAQMPEFQTPYVTRAEAAMLLLQARVPKIPALVSNGEFPDVPPGAWYERYIVVAERLGILQAHSITRRIRPEDPVTRAEFVSMLAKTFGVNTTLFAPTYSDVSAEAWFAESAGMAERLRLFPADPDPTIFRPDEFMIHSEVAKALQILTDATMDAGQWKPVDAKESSSYANISTSTEEISIVKPRGSSPHLVSVVKKTPAGSSSTTLTSKLRLEVLKLVNAERAKSGLAGLRMNPTLQTSAQQYARDMAIDNFFGHISPSGETLKNRMEKSGYYRPFFQSDCLCVARYLMGENLARGQKTAKEVVRDWLRSPGHREAMLNEDFTDTGIGIVAGVWVEHFGGKQK